MNAQPISQVLSKVLAATPEQPTKVEPATTRARPNNFDWAFQTLNDPVLEKLLAATKRFAESILLKEDPHWLSLLGTSGAGKTHLAKRLLAYWRERGGWRLIKGNAGQFYTLGDSRLVSWRKFIERQRDGQYGEIEGIRETPFVVIDDIGAERDPSGFAKEKLDAIIDGRLGKWTVITSNLSLSQIAEIDVRIASRMKRGESKIIDIKTTDYNLRRK